MSTYSLDIVVPCYNPTPQWAQKLSGYFLQYATITGANALGLIVVNDGSVRNFSSTELAILKSSVSKLTVLSYPENRGKGHALRQGVAASKADLAIVTDVDFPYTLDSIRAIEARLSAGGAVVIGHRKEDYYQQVPWFRKQLSRSFRFFLGHLLGLRHQDSQCGLKGFDRSGRVIFLQTTIDRYLFDLEFLILANRSVGVISVPVQLREGVTFSTMGIKILLTELRNFLKIIWLRFIN